MHFDVVASRDGGLAALMLATPACGGGDGSPSPLPGRASGGAVQPTAIDVGQTTASGKLLPAPIGDGICTAGSVSDGVYAQVAILNPSCSTVVTTAAPAGVDRGAPYSTDGLPCTATAESASSSPWDSGWNSTYYAYTCVGGSE